MCEVPTPLLLLSPFLTIYLDRMHNNVCSQPVVSAEGLTSSGTVPSRCSSWQGFGDVSLRAELIPAT